MNCGRGKIVRSAYYRKDGTFVRATCVPDKGLPGKTPTKRKVLPKPTAGNLGQYGYHNIKSLTLDERHTALTKAVKRSSYATVIRRLNLLANLNKNSDPVLYKRLQLDMNWIRKNLYMYSKSGTKN